MSDGEYLRSLVDENEELRQVLTVIAETTQEVDTLGRAYSVLNKFPPKSNEITSEDMFPQE